MKKIVLFILALLTLFSLVACGEKAPEYKYDNIPELDLSQTFLNLFSARPIKGGALSIIEPHIYRGQDIVVEDWESEPISVLFDEENKFLLPLCYDYTCQHDGPDCFSYALAWAQGSYWNVVDDMIVVVNDVFAYQIVGDLDPNCIYAFYFSLDGTLVDKVSFDMTTLIKQDGSFAEEPSQGLYCTAYKNNVYLDVHDWADLSGEDKPKNRWVVCYDLEKKEFYSAAHYILPYASWEGNYVTFEECTETEIGIVYNNRYAYSINLEDGSWTETDCAEIYDNLIIKGIAHPGTTVSRILPLSNIIADFCYPICYYDTVTEERIELSENDAPYYYGRLSYYYDGGRIYAVDSDENNNIIYSSDKKQKKMAVNQYFENGAYDINDLIIESENGFIFHYYKSGEGREDEQYIVIENGREVLYQKAESLVYVTKDDYFDGQIDDPWYYDAETGMFVQK